MKRVFCLWIAVLFLLTAVPVSVAAEETLSFSGFYYTVEDGAATVTGYNKNQYVQYYKLMHGGEHPGFDVELPSTVDDYPVEKIGESAFECHGYETFVIPDSVKVIGKNAFRSPGGAAALLKNLVLGNGVITIEEGAFAYCKGLKNVVLPEGLTFIGEGAFSNTDFSNGDLPDSLTYIGEGAFSNTPITTIHWPKNAKTIPRQVFDGCSQLTEIHLPASVTAIQDSAFDVGDDAAVYITDIAAWCTIAFETQWGNPLEGGAKLYLNGQLVTDLTIPESVTAISDYVFYDYGELKTLVVPGTVNTIGEDAFGCSGLTSITLGEGVTRINDFAFSGTDLDTIALPASLESVGFGAFSGSVKDVYYAGSQSDWSGVLVDEANEALDQATWHYNVTLCAQHQYANPCSTSCVNCGATRPFPGHAYDNACDPDCNKCGAVRTPADHRYEADWDIDCDECGAIREHPEHLYDDSWDEECNLCDATRRVVRIVKQPQSICVGEGENALVLFEASGDGLTYEWYWAKPGSNKFYLTPTFTINGYAAIMNADRHNRRVYCVVSDAYGNSLQTDTVTMCMHTYDGAYDPDCNGCGTIREISLPIAFGGNSFSEEVSGLAFRFDVAAEGFSLSGYTADYSHATIGGNKLVGLGAVLSNNGTELTRENANGNTCLDVPAVYLLEATEISASFAVRAIHIPITAYSTKITARPYFIYEDAQGTQVILYGEVQTCTVDHLR